MVVDSMVPVPPENITSNKYKQNQMHIIISQGFIIMPHNYGLHTRAHSFLCFFTIAVYVPSTSRSIKS